MSYRHPQKPLHIELIPDRWEFNLFEQFQKFLFLSNAFFKSKWPWLVSGKQTNIFWKQKSIKGVIRIRILRIRWINIHLIMHLKYYFKNTFRRKKIRYDWVSNIISTYVIPLVWYFMLCFIKLYIPHFLTLTVEKYI